MVITASFRTFVQFHNFRNVDLFHQGFYKLRCRVYVGGTPAIAGVPLKRYPTASSTIRNPGGDAHLLLPAEIQPQTQSFTTRTFQIRFCDEDVELNDGVEFGIELDLTTTGDLLETAVQYMEVEMLYSEMVPTSSLATEELGSTTNNCGGGGFESGTAQNLLAACAMKDNNSNGFEERKFLPYSYQVFRISRIFTGVSSFVPITFDHLHSAIVHCTVTTILLEVRQKINYNPILCKEPPRYSIPKPAPSLSYKAAPPPELKVATSSNKSSSSLRRKSSAAAIISDLNNRFPHTAPEDIMLLHETFDKAKFLSSPINNKKLLPLSLEEGFLVSADRVHKSILVLLYTNFCLISALFTSLKKRGGKEDFVEKEGTLPYTLELDPTNGLPCTILNKKEGLTAPLKIRIPRYFCMNSEKATAPPSLMRIVDLEYLPLGVRTSSSSSSNAATLSVFDSVGRFMCEDWCQVFVQIYEIWNSFLNLSTEIHREKSFYHQFIFEKFNSARFKELIFCKTYASNKLFASCDDSSHSCLGSVHQKLADHLRGGSSSSSAPLDEELFVLPIEDVSDPFLVANRPILFCDSYYEAEGENESHHGSSNRNIVHRHTRMAKLEGTSFLLKSHSSLSNTKVTSLTFKEADKEKLKQEEAEAEEEAFEGLKTLAAMKRAEEQSVEVPLFLNNSPSTLSDKEDGGDDNNSMNSKSSSSSCFPGDEYEDLAEEDLMYLMNQCSIFKESPSAPKLYGGLHLIVLVHGFQGNAFDMRVIRNALSTVFPEATYLSSNANEEHTEGDIFDMGVRLATEISDYVEELCGVASISRLSFICHSLGGVIARASLKHLSSALQSRFHLFLTLSSPHLGYIFARNRLVDAGLWVLKRWKRSVGLQQLSMGDSKDPRDTVLYKLSQTSHLDLFSQLCFVSCYQDQYVPYESSRVEISEKLKADLHWGQIHSEMVENLLKHVSAKKLLRLDVNFKISDRSLDSFIGRTAHIQFLSSRHLIDSLIYVFPQFFS